MPHLAKGKRPVQAIIVIQRLMFLPVLSKQRWTRQSCLISLLAFLPESTKITKLWSLNRDLEAWLFSNSANKCLADATEVEFTICEFVFDLGCIPGIIILVEIAVVSVLIWWYALFCLFLKFVLCQYFVLYRRTYDFQQSWHLKTKKHVQEFI